MAPKGSKRASSAPAPSSPAKKAKGAAAAKAAVAKKLQAIADALSLAELPDEPKKMLTCNLMESLGVPEDSRHPIQEKVVSWIKETLGQVEESLKKDIEAAEQKTSEADSEKAQRAEAETAAKDELQSKVQVAVEKKEAVKAAVLAHKAAKAALASSRLAQEEGDKSAGEAEAKKEALKAILADAFAPLKGGGLPSAETSQKISALQQIGKEYELEASMLTSLPSSLRKAVADRGTFDAMVLEHVESTLNKKIEELTETIANAEPAKQERAQAVEAAEAALTAAAAEEENSKAAVKEAEVAKKAADETFKAAAKSVKSFGPELKEQADKLDTAKKQLADLQEGALAYFAELEVAPSPEKAAEIAAAKKAEEDAEAAKKAAEEAAKATEEPAAMAVEGGSV